MKITTLNGFIAYVEHGVPPGGFLLAVLENNLKEAFIRADEENRIDMFEIVRYLYNEVPHAAQGSPEKVRLWLEYKAREREAFAKGGRP